MTENHSHFVAFVMALIVGFVYLIHPAFSAMFIIALIVELGFLIEDQTKQIISQSKEKNSGGD